MEIFLQPFQILLWKEIFIMEGDVPKPCRYFCGREKEIEQLHELLVKERKVFLHGIAGIGKSELVNL